MGKPHENCDHDHDHSHDGHHHHGPGHHHHGVSERLGLAFGLNLTFALIELVGGYFTNSVAIMSDALHDFGDAMAIGLAFFMEKKSMQKSDRDFSYGYRRYSMASALITGLVLAVGSVVILVEALPRLWAPQPSEANGMIGLAILGLAVNGFAAWRVSRGISVHERMIMLHLMEDVFGWIIVLVGAVAIKIFGWLWVDPLLACGLACWILFNVVKNLKVVVRVLLQAVPTSFDLSEIERKVLRVAGVKGLHHVHLWSIDGQQHVFTGHVVVSEMSLKDADRIKGDVKKLLGKHGISEATLEFETDGSDCADPEHGC